MGMVGNGVSITDDMFEDITFTSGFTIEDKKIDIFFLASTCEV
jgi:hypothetical protein